MSFMDGFASVFRELGSKFVEFFGDSFGYSLGEFVAVLLISVPVALLFVLAVYVAFKLEWI